MPFFKLIFDWLVLTPGAGVAYLIACLIGMLALASPVLAWHWTIRFFEPASPGLGQDNFPGRPRSLSTGVVASIAALYVFAVTAAAIYDLPRVMSAIAAD